jgi:hypothetical protein
MPRSGPPPRKDHRSVHRTVLLAIETFLALRETAGLRADPDALPALDEAREAVRAGRRPRAEDVRTLRGDRRAS